MNIKHTKNKIIFQYPTLQSYLHTNGIRRKTNLELVNPILEIRARTIYLMNNAWPHAGRSYKQCCLGSYSSVFSLLQNKQYESAYYCLWDYLSTFNNNGFWNIHLDRMNLNQKQTDYIRYCGEIYYRKNTFQLKCGTHIPNSARNRFANVDIENVRYSQLVLCTYCGHYKLRNTKCKTH